MSQACIVMKDLVWKVSLYWNS